MPSEVVAQRAERKRAEARQELADAAFEVFAERGYHSTRIADITGHLGVGQSTFYKHFENKREVVDYVLNGFSRKLFGAIVAENAAAVANSLDEYLSQVDRITTAMFSMLATEAETLRVLLREVVNADPELQALYSGVMEQARQAVAGYYDNGIAKGFFRPDIDVAASSEACVGLLMGGLDRIMRQPEDADGYRRYVDAALGLVVGGAVPR